MDAFAAEPQSDVEAPRTWGAGDISTLANREVVETIQHHVQAAKVERGELPRELSEQELKEIKALGQAE